MKKYYIRHCDENGHLIFNSTSDSAKALLKRYRKAAYSPESGLYYPEFYFGNKDTNVTKDIELMIKLGFDI